MIIALVSIVLICIGLAALAIKYYRANSAMQARLTRYSALVSIEDEVKRQENEKAKIEQTLRAMAELHDKAKKEYELYSEANEMVSFGLYTPRYDFANSKDYADRLDRIREEQKALIKREEAILCPHAWTVNGSKAEGKKMMKHITKLGLNAFNVQCDNTILKVTAQNITASQERLSKIRENIDSLLKEHACHISSNFFKLKLDELHLAYEYELKLDREKEEQRRIKEQMREEEKVRREIEKAQAEAEKDEKAYAKALEKARADLEKKSESERAAYQDKIQELERQLKEAQEKKARAISQAEQTRRGHVYIISNIGSFGENVFKIGLTRRLEPMERIQELSDAAVPFAFDVHAMIFSEDAPNLEKKLHDAFSGARLNRVNERKEFFRVSLAEIQYQCRSLGHKIEFTLLAEAREYRQSLAIAQLKQANATQSETKSTIQDKLAQIVNGSGSEAA